MSSWMSRAIGSHRTSPSSSSSSLHDTKNQKNTTTPPNTIHGDAPTGHHRAESHAVSSRSAQPARSNLFARRSASSQSTQPRITPTKPPVPSLSQPVVPTGSWSSPAIPNSMFFASNFLIGVGLLIIQPATGKVAIVHDSKAPGYFFLPKGRKDVGEDIIAAALREGYEESGYRATLMSLPVPTLAPYPPEDKRSWEEKRLTSEPIYVSTQYYRSDHRREPGIYFTFWFVGEIPADAEYKSGTGMADEQNFVTELVDYDEARSKLYGTQIAILEVGYHLWQCKEQMVNRTTPSVTPP
ncbi:hypothetical protein BXZ70DRAFT_1006334 [Cristinia sonorae]|uniref:Nudix hydrolase domain-containing protein n=1 Tax=Cristinia sonorae TaxID=1940300 RepID=A0A8K0XRL6_9AGAR|nr:hypothetical protein BXZ70DRAFT_1006334 [Cristinia sonorae]